MSKSLEILTHGGRALVRYRQLNRSPVNPISDKRRAERRQYIKAKKAFLLAHPLCAWGLAQVPQQMIRATNIHHSRGRVGALYLNEKFWLAVSDVGHRAIHDAPEAARKLGLLCSVGCWGKNEP